MNTGNGALFSCPDIFYTNNEHRKRSIVFMSRYLLYKQRTQEMEHCFHVQISFIQTTNTGNGALFSCPDIFYTNNEHRKRSIVFMSRYLLYKQRTQETEHCFHVQISFIQTTNTGNGALFSCPDIFYTNNEHRKRSIVFMSRYLLYKQRTQETEHCFHVQISFIQTTNTGNGALFSCPDIFYTNNEHRKWSIVFMSRYLLYKQRTQETEHCFHVQISFVYTMNTGNGALFSCPDIFYTNNEHRERSIVFMSRYILCKQ